MMKSTRLDAEHFKVQAHGTPGITDPTGAASKCAGYDVQHHIKPVAEAILDGPDKVAGAPSKRAEDTCVGGNCKASRKDSSRIM
jgi:hypothetical protein